MNCSMKLFLITATSAIFFTTGCKSKLPAGDFSTTLSSSGGEAVIQCLTPEGNGGNWPATIGWMSEQLNQRALEFQNQPSTKFYLQCMIGGSSGSASTALYMNVLFNKNLFPAVREGYLYSLSELQVASRALRFMAVSLDYTLGEGLVFYRNLFRSQAYSRIRNSNTAKRVSEKLGSNDPRWWSGEAADPKLLLTEYAKIMLLANSLTREDLTGALSTENIRWTSNERHMVEKKGITSALDFIEDEQKQDRDSAYAKQFSGIFKKQAELVTKVSKARITSVSNANFLQRYFRKVEKDSSDSPLKAAVDKRMQRGFCTATMGEVHTSRDTVDRYIPPRYENLRLIVICDRSTIEKIISSSAYQEDIRSGKRYADKIFFAATKSTRSAITMSIREPGLMTELVDEADGKILDIQSYYDSRKDTTREFRIKNATDDGIVFAIAGGFPDRRISAWALTYYYKVLQNEINGGNNRGYFSLFGKPDDPSTPTFSINAVRNVFSPEEKKVSNVADWITYHKTWCQTYGQELSTPPRSNLETVVVNWDIHVVPAAQSFIKPSYLLAVKSINSTNYQISASLGKKPQPRLHEPTSYDVPNTKTSEPCTRY